MTLWAEVWTRPGAVNFRRLIDDIPFRAGSIHDAFDDIGDGSLTVPDTFGRFDEILKVAGANSASSMIRIRNGNGDIVFEWIPSQIEPVAEKGDPYVEISGRGIKEILEYAVTMPYDFDGTGFQVPSSPNWLWGADNILGLPGFEDPPVTPKTIELVIVATGGTYTLTDLTDTTDPIAWDAGASVIEDAIQNDLGLLPDVAVSLAGPGRHLIQLVDPPFGVNLGIDDSLLTGPDAEGTTETTVEGGFGMSPWTAAHALVSGGPTMGAYDDLYISPTSPRTGLNSMLVNPGQTGPTSNRGGGFQQVVTVNPGEIYQAGIWVRPEETDDEWRLGLFTIGEEPIAVTEWGGETFPTGVYSLMSLTNVTMPEGVTQAIFRLTNTNPHSHNAGTTRFDDAYMYPGLAPTTPGDILGLLYVGYTTAPNRSPILWDHGDNPTWPFLTLDFDAVNDSNGDPWDYDDVSMEVWMRMTLWDVLKEFQERLGLEFRVVPDDPEVGTWLLQVYNAGGMDAAPDVAIMGGSRDTRRMIRRYRPANVYVVEGEGRVVAHATLPDLMADFGRIESARLNRMVPPAEDAAVASALRDAIDGPIVGTVWSYEQTDPFEEIGNQYVIGDTVTIHDPPEVDTGSARTWSYTATLAPDGVIWDVDYLPPEAIGPGSPVDE